MSDQVDEFIEPVRWLLGDHNDAIRMYPDAVYERGIKTIVKGGQVDGYTLAGDQVTIVPDVPDGPTFLLLAAKVALGFAQSFPARQGTRTRAWSETIGDYDTLVDRLRELVYDCENGNMGVGFQGYLAFISGYTRMEGKVWQFMARLTFLGPPLQVSLP